MRYAYDVRLAKRQARLDRVNSQLQHFYGQLKAILVLEEDLFQVFKDEHSIGSGFWQNQGDDPTPEQGKVWRKWISGTFMPLNERMFDLVKNRADLIEEIVMPEEFRLLGLHVASYKILQDQWSECDFSRHLPEVFFPQKIHDYATYHYERLKS